MVKKKNLVSPFVSVEEQPYPIPDNWCWVRLSALSRIISKGTTPTGGKDAYVDVGVNFVRVENLNADGTISHENIAHIEENVHTGFLKRSILQENDILISIAGTLGKTGIVRGVDLPLNTNQALAFVRISSQEIAKEYIKNAIDSTVIQEILLGKTKVTSIPNLTLEIISNCPIPLSPSPEQQRIVDRIESLFAKLDEAKEKAQAVVDSFDLRKAAILHKAFTGELTERWRKIHTASPNTLLSDIEKFSHSWQKKDQQFLKVAQSSSQVVNLDNGHTWIKCTIGAISRVTNGSTPSRKVSEYWDGTIPWVSSGEVRNNIIENTTECITQEGYDNSSVKLLPTGTVLIAMIGEGKTRGQSAILAIDATINQNIAAVVVDHGLVISRYIWYWFQMNYSKNREKGAGSGPQALNCQRVRELDFYVPNMPEQKEIVCILDKLLGQEVQAKEAAEAVLDQIDTMKKAILARAFRGELGTNDPAEEWAGELVKKV